MDLLLDWTTEAFPSLDKLINEWVWFESQMCRGWLQGHLCAVLGLKPDVNSMAAQGKSDLPRKYLVMGKSPMELEMTSAVFVAGKS